MCKVKQKMINLQTSLSVGSKGDDIYEDDEIEISLKDTNDNRKSNISTLSINDQMSKTFDLGQKKANVPKLDFSSLKHNKEFKDWYKYSIKLETSVKSLRARIKVLEDDLEDCNNKNQNLRKQNANLYSLNKKLMVNIKDLKQKIVDTKERYNWRVRRAQQYGVNELEMTLPRFETEGDNEYRQITDDVDFEDYRSTESYSATQNFERKQLRANTITDNDNSWN